MIRKQTGFRSFTTLAALLLASIPIASAAPRLEIEVSVQEEFEIERPDGTSAIELRPVEFASPGDVLVYTLRATNVGEGPAHAARIDDPIPAGTLLLPESVGTAGATAHASLDGGRSFQEFPVLVERRTEDGRVERVPAPPESYTHLRWLLTSPIGPGEGRDVSFKVRIR